MILEYHRQTERFVFRCSYDERLLPKSMGFYWDPKRKEWYCDAAKWYLADQLSRYSDESAAYQLKKNKGQITDVSIEASYKAHSTIEVPSPDGLRYLPYQLAGIEFAYNHPKCLIADEPGLGKTIQAAGLINFLPEARYILVICPASLKLNWFQELSKWLVDKRLTIGVVHKNNFPQTNIVIINYDIVVKFFDQLQAVDWHLIVCDESHYLKSNKAKRTKAALKLSAPRELWLTGTPILNRPEEVWTTVKKLGGVNWNRNEFYSRYVYGFRNAELQHRLRSSFMIRRLKSDVLPEIPDKTRQIIEVPSERSLLEKEAQVWREMTKSFDASGTMSFETAVSGLQKQFGTDWTDLSEIRIEAAMSKLKYVKEFANELIDGGNKVIIFAHHHKIIKELQSFWPHNSVTLFGETSISDKNLAVTNFQKNEQIKVFIGGIKAAGLGITLTASHYVIFAELDFTPAVMNQCEDRAHRIGQKHPLFIYHFVLEGSFDSRMARILLNKQKMIDATISTSEDREGTPYKNNDTKQKGATDELVSENLARSEALSDFSLHNSEQSDDWVCSQVRLQGF